MRTINLKKRKIGPSKSVDSPTSSQLSIKKATLLTPGNQRHEVIITCNAINFLCKDNVAFNAVSKAGFQKLLHVLEPRYQIPNTSIFSKIKVIKLLDATRESVMNDLSDVNVQCVNVPLGKQESTVK